MAVPAPPAHVDPPVTAEEQATLDFIKKAEVQELHDMLLHMENPEKPFGGCVLAPSERKALGEKLILEYARPTYNEELEDLYKAYEEKCWGKGAVDSVLVRKK